MTDKYEVVISLEGRDLDVSFGPTVMDYDAAVKYKKLIKAALIIAEQLENELKDEDYLYSYDSEYEDDELTEDDFEEWDERDEC